MTSHPASEQDAAETAQLVIAPAGWRVSVRPGQSLLEAADAAGIRLPRSCRNGTCRRCLCQRTAGTTRDRIEWPGVSAEERSAGWILPCVAEAESAEVTLYVPDAIRQDDERSPKVSTPTS